jgi:hypothetical protein
VVTLATRSDRGGLLLWSVNLASKLNFPPKPEGQPVVSEVVLKVEVRGSKVTESLTILFTEQDLKRSDHGWQMADRMGLRLR